MKSKQELNEWHLANANRANRLAARRILDQYGELVILRKRVKQLEKEYWLDHIL